MFKKVKVLTGQAKELATSMELQPEDMVFIHIEKVEGSPTDYLKNRFLDGGIRDDIFRVCPKCSTNTKGIIVRVSKPTVFMFTCSECENIWGERIENCDSMAYVPESGDYHCKQTGGCCAGLDECVMLLLTATIKCTRCGKDSVYNRHDASKLRNYEFITCPHCNKNLGNPNTQHLERDGK